MYMQGLVTWAERNGHSRSSVYISWNSHFFSRPTYNEYNIDNNVEERLAENHQEDECGTQADARERAADLGSAQFRSQHKWVPLGRDG